MQSILKSLYIAYFAAFLAISRNYFPDFLHKINPIPTRGIFAPFRVHVALLAKFGVGVPF
jgi:hypothetical protein